MQPYQISFRFKTPNKRSGEITDQKANKQIGTFEMYVEGDMFGAAINLFTEYQNKGIGFSIFQESYQALKRFNKMNCFFASWTKHDEYAHLTNSSSINLIKFWQLINEGVSEEAAAWQTPSGKWLKRLGFHSVEIVHKSSDKVEVIFKHK